MPISDRPAEPRGKPAGGNLRHEGSLQGSPNRTKGRKGNAPSFLPTLNYRSKRSLLLLGEWHFYKIYHVREGRGSGRLSLGRQPKYSFADGTQKWSKYEHLNLETDKSFLLRSLNFGWVVSRQFHLTTSW